MDLFANMLLLWNIMRFITTDDQEVEEERSLLDKMDKREISFNYYDSTSGSLLFFCHLQLRSIFLSCPIPSSCGIYVLRSQKQILLNRANVPVLLFILCCSWGSYSSFSVPITLVALKRTGGVDHFPWDAWPTASWTTWQVIICWLKVSPSCLHHHLTEFCLSSTCRLFLWDEPGKSTPHPFI